MRAIVIAAALLAVGLVQPAWAARHAHKPKAPTADNAVIAPVPSLLPLPSKSKPSLTLDDALAIAYESNPQFAAQQAALRATDEGVAIANGAWHPQIGAQGTYAYNQYYFFPIPAGSFPGQTAAISSLSAHPLQGGLTVTQPIFRGGRTVAEVGRAKALVRAGRAQLLAAEQTVLLSAATAYMDVVRDTAIVVLREHNVEVLQKQAAATRAEFSAGSLTRTDVAQSLARLAGAQSDLTAARSQLAISRANFVQTIGREAETLEQEPGLPAGLPSGVDDSVTLALRQNPSMISARENEVAADYAVDDALGALLPTFSVQGQYGYSQGALISPTGSANVDTGSGPPHTADHFVAVTGQLNVPIYEGGAEDATVRQAKQLHAEAQFN
ncbi:MAG: TolC family protein, partial [Steroidobacteraceae bacterium]